MRSKQEAWTAEEIDGKPVYTYKNEFRGLKDAGKLDKARDLDQQRPGASMPCSPGVGG